MIMISVSVIWLKSVQRDIQPVSFVHGDTSLLPFP